MAIIINIDVMMAKRKMSLGELAERVDITPANLSILKNGKAKAIRFSPLEAICRELEAYNPDLLKRPQVIAANKIDSIFVEEGQEDPISRLKREFEPDIPVYPISGVTGQGIRELLYGVYEKLQTVDQAPVIFEKEFDINELRSAENLPYTVEVVDGVYVVEGPRIEKMLGYTNLESEKGFVFFQNFLRENGILDKLEEAGIQEGDTVRMYGLEFDYYK